MFWKRKKEHSDTFSHETDNKRSSFRISPPEHMPIVMHLEKNKIQLLDIGAGGVAFENINFKLGNTFPVSFDLPILDINISTRLEIIAIDKRNICRGQFIGMEEKDVEGIHQYLLILQREAIKQKKKRWLNLLGLKL
ncbi:MAG: hypothetical protein GY857_04860 [Desulfobacula sp.]|nr:hypothetical protein [Desulfobacula sp.]